MLDGRQVLEDAQPIWESHQRMVARLGTLRHRVQASYEEALIAAARGVNWWLPPTASSLAANPPPDSSFPAATRAPLRCSEAPLSIDPASCDRLHCGADGADRRRWALAIVEQPAAIRALARAANVLPARPQLIDSVSTLNSLDA
jgi:hypothetical protein